MSLAHKVGTADAGLVGVVEDKGAVAEECADALVCRCELVGVGSLERVRLDLAVLAAQVTNLARLGSRRVARWVLAAQERVQVRECRGAVAIGAGSCVEVVL